MYILSSPFFTQCPSRYGLSVVIKLPVVCRASTLLMIFIYLTTILVSSQGKLARNSWATHVYLTCEFYLVAELYDIYNHTISNGFPNFITTYIYVCLINHSLINYICTCIHVYMCLCNAATYLRTNIRTCIYVCTNMFECIYAYKHMFHKSVKFQCKKVCKAHILMK